MYVGGILQILLQKCQDVMLADIPLLQFWTKPPYQTLWHYGEGEGVIESLPGRFKLFSQTPTAYGYLSCQKFANRRKPEHVSFSIESRFVFPLPVSHRELATQATLITCRLTCPRTRRAQRVLEPTQVCHPVPSYRPS